MSDWIMLVPSIIFARIKSEFDISLKTEYEMQDTYFSTTDSSNKKAVFPFVFVKAMGSQEQGQTLDGQMINAGMFTFQVDVYDNKTQQRARKVMGEIIRIMKSMRFEIVSMPEFESTDVHRCTARFRRLIGANDKF